MAKYKWKKHKKYYTWTSAGSNTYDFRGINIQNIVYDEFTPTDITYTITRESHPIYTMGYPTPTVFVPGNLEYTITTTSGATY